MSAQTEHLAPAARMLLVACGPHEGAGVHKFGAMSFAAPPTAYSEYPGKTAESRRDFEDAPCLLAPNVCRASRRGRQHCTAASNSPDRLALHAGRELFQGTARGRSRTTSSRSPSWHRWCASTSARRSPPCGYSMTRFALGLAVRQPNCARAATDQAEAVHGKGANNNALQLPAADIRGGTRTAPSEHRALGEANRFHDCVCLRQRPGAQLGAAVNGNRASATLRCPHDVCRNEEHADAPALNRGYSQ